MIWTVFRIGLARLLHNRVELLLTFVVPIAFFSIFALIFGKGLGGSSTPKIKAVIVDPIGSPQSRMVADRIRQLEGLRMMEAGNNQKIIDEQRARDLVRRGMVTIAVVLRNDDAGLTADLLSDASDQVAGQVCSAMIAQALIVPPDSRISHQFATSKSASSKSAVSKQTAYRPQSDPVDVGNGNVEAPVRQPEGSRTDTATPVATTSPEPNASPVRIVDVIAGDKANPVVSMYAAGIAVMFLLFGATGGGGSLLEEQESHTLHRLLTTRLTMDQLLMGKWLYQTVLGIVQVFVMFLWGWLVFGVDLWSNFDGFVLMTVVTAGAASSFGLLMATFSRTRSQLNGISVILILTMSALGGSMVPRYLMNETLRDAGLYTFNAWALDGFDKVFWRELPASELWPQICVLMLSGAAFLVVARLLAIRWETA